LNEGLNTATQDGKRAWARVDSDCRSFDHDDELSDREAHLACDRMLLRRLRPSRSGLRDAVRDARDTYRHYSGADAGVSRTPAPPEAARPAAHDAAPAAPRTPTLAERAKESVRGLRERAHQLPVAVRRDEPDVVLDIPKLHVDEIDLKLDELKARVALEAHVLDLLRLDVGVDAELRGVGLQIKGVDAEAHLKVRLENLTVIVDRVMKTIDSNPQMIERLTEHLGATLEQVGSGAGKAVGEIGESAGSAVEEIGGVARKLAPGGQPASDEPSSSNGASA
jgi:hypothetical protein